MAGILKPEVEVEVQKALRDKSGWWVRAVLSTFDGIATDFGYELERVQMHFRGNYVWYRGSFYRIALELDLESSVLTGDLWVVGDLDAASHPRTMSIPRLLDVRAPTASWEPPDAPGSLTEAAVASVLERWANGLRTYAPDVLAGALPADAPWGHLW